MSDAMQHDKAFVITARFTMNKIADDVVSDYRNYIKAHADENKDNLIDFFVNQYAIRARDYLLGALSAISMFEILDSQEIDSIKKKLGAHIDQTAESIKKALEV